MTVVVTGAFGNVGRSTVKALLERGDAVFCFDLPTKRNLKLARRPGRAFGIDAAASALGGWRDRLRFFWGDIRRQGDIERCLPGADAVCHLAAIIPPAADDNPALAYDVNVNGTRALLSAIKAGRAMGMTPFLVFASSVAVYGDRLDGPEISVDDPLRPSPGDEYASQKILCERLLRDSGLPALVLRLSYIVWRKKLDCHPIMFRMPLRTKLEICHTEDAGLAFANATAHPEAAGQVLHVAGGERCRISYRDYLDRMLGFFGLGGVGRLPAEAFSERGYHCGFMDTSRSQDLLCYQRRSLEDYFAEVKQEARSLRAWARLLAPAILRSILKGSLYLRPRRLPDRTEGRLAGRRAPQPA